MTVSKLDYKRSESTTQSTVALTNRPAAATDIISLLLNAAAYYCILTQLVTEIRYSIRCDLIMQMCCTMMLHY